MASGARYLRHMAGNFARWGTPSRSLSVSLSASRLQSVDRAIVVMRNVRGSAAGHGRSPVVARMRSGLSHEVANSWLSAVVRDCVLLDRSSRRGHPHPQGWFTDARKEQPRLVRIYSAVPRTTSRGGSA